MREACTSVAQASLAWIRAKTVTVIMLVAVLMVLMVSAKDDRDGDGGFERFRETQKSSRS